MASGTLVGGGGEGSREKQRWSENKVYTRKAHNKRPKPALDPQPPSPKQTLATTAEDANSCLPDHHQPSAPPSRIDSSAASEDDASSLNHRKPESQNLAGDHLPNGERHDVSTSLASRTQDDARELDARELRQKLTTDLEQVRALINKVEARELQLSAVAAPAAGYSLSQLSGNETGTPLASNRMPAKFEATSTAPTSSRFQLSVSLPNGLAVQHSISEAVEKEKRTPKANQYYQNSDFVLGKEKFPPPDTHKKKANGSRKQEHGMQAVEKKLYGHIRQAFRSCGALLAKLMKHKFGWVFNTPVDVKGLGLHDYYVIIKRPMDLGTVKSRLSKNWYNSPEEFAEDVRLTFRNAMTYNPRGQDVHFMAEQLSQIFEERWPAIEAEYAHLSYLPATKKSPPVDTRTLGWSYSTHPMAVDLKTKPVNYVPHIVRPPPLKKPKAKDPHKRDMTFEEKQKLSSNLQNLPPEKLDNIVQIIKKRNLSLDQHDDEIEIDIDNVDAETLWELDRFVTNYKKSLSKKKRKAELAIAARLQEANPHIQGRLQEMITDDIGAELPKLCRAVVGEKNMASSMPVGGESKEDTASRSSSSSSSSSDSGSSSSDSDSESSSAYGSDAAHSPRT